MEEFSTSNFFGVKADGSYVTPASAAVLPSITNKSLMELAAAEGRKVEQRDVPVEEVGGNESVIAFPVGVCRCLSTQSVLSGEMGPVLTVSYHMSHRLLLYVSPSLSMSLRFILRLTILSNLVSFNFSRVCNCIRLHPSRKSQLAGPL